MKNKFQGTNLGRFYAACIDAHMEMRGGDAESTIESVKSVLDAYASLKKTDREDKDIIGSVQDVFAFAATWLYEEEAE